MRIWGKRIKEKEVSGASVARAALAGASHEGLVREALRALTQVPRPDRVGIWLEPEANPQSPSEISGAFYGLVSDRVAGEECPPEWKFLSVEPPLPEQLLLRAEPFEQNIDDAARNAVIGQLVGLRRALWVPVADQGPDCPGRVKGLILLGNVNHSLAPFLDRAKSVAAELALALRAEEQFRAVRIATHSSAMQADFRGAVEMKRGLVRLIPTRLEMQLASAENTQTDRLANAANTRAEQFAGAEHAPSAPYAAARPASVLVVEDEPTVARLIADVREDEGMHVDVLLDGREALDVAARESYDLVICDMKMPGLDGQHFYRSLARNDNSLRERFLFVTGDVMAAHARWWSSGRRRNAESWLD